MYVNTEDGSYFLPSLLSSSHLHTCTHLLIHPQINTFIPPNYPQPSVPTLFIPQLSISTTHPVIHPPPFFQTIHFNHTLQIIHSIWSSPNVSLPFTRKPSTLIHSHPVHLHHSFQLSILIHFISNHPSQQISPPTIHSNPFHLQPSIPTHFISNHPFQPNSSPTIHFNQICLQSSISTKFISNHPSPPKSSP